jgi:formamidopyrimidine-DNA glycosylase
MPELPEVETVRRGLAPVMEGARFVAVVAHRGDLRWPLPKDFAQRLEGQTVIGLGRRAKYLLADLSSGDVLLMHLGMSGSFRVTQDKKASTPGRYYRERSQDETHDHVVFRMSSGATGRVHGSTRSHCCARSGRSRSATNSTPPRWRAPAKERTPA